MTIQKSFGTILRDNPDIENLAKTFPILTGDLLKDVIMELHQSLVYP